MGLLTSATICSAGFLLGVLFTCLIWDSTILWPQGKLTEEVIVALENYYLTWWSAPTAVKVFLHVVLISTFMSMVAKFARYTEAAFYFSGASLLLMILSMSLYIVITLPSLRQLALDPLDKNALVAPGMDLYTRVQSWYNKEINSELLAFTPMDWDERITLLSVMSAANTLAIVLLVGVVILQVSEWYVEEQYTAEIEQERIASRAAAIAKQEKKINDLVATATKKAPVTEEKKKQ